MRAVVLMAMGAALAGCEYVPGTTEHNIAVAEARVARALGYEAKNDLRFTSVLVNKGHPENSRSTATVCGRVSTVGSDGRISEGPRYLADVSSDVTSVQPTPPGYEYELAGRACASAIRIMGLRENSPATERICQRLDEENAKMAVSMAFVEQFQGYCPEPDYVGAVG